MRTLHLLYFLAWFTLLDDVDRVFRFCYGVCSLSLNDESFQQTGRNSCPLWSKVSKNFICIGDLIEYWGFSFKKQKILKSPWNMFRVCKFSTRHEITFMSHYMRNSLKWEKTFRLNTCVLYFDILLIYKKTLILLGKYKRYILCKCTN